MSNNKRNMKSAKFKFSATTAMVIILSAPAAVAAPVELVHTNSYNAHVTGTDGYVESSGGATSAYLTTNSPTNAIIGGDTSDGNPGYSLEVTNNSTLTLGIFETAPTNAKVVFEKDVVETSGDIIINLETDLQFRGNVSNITINANDASSLEFAYGDNGDTTIGASFGDLNGNVMDISIHNATGSAGNTITFANSFNQAIRNLVIADAGASNTNNVIYTGDSLEAAAFNIGVAGGANQTHNITFNAGTATDITAAITGNAADTVNIIAENTTGLRLNGAVTGVDTLTLSDDSTLQIRNNYTGALILVNGGADSSISMNNQGMVGPNAIAVVNAGIDSSADIGGFQTVMENAHYTGTFNHGSSNDTITLLANSEISGTVNFGGGTDFLESYGAGNLISGTIDFGTGTNTLSIGDDEMAVTGSLLNLTNIFLDNGGLNVGSDIQASNTIEFAGSSSLRIQAGKTLTVDNMSTTDSSSKIIFDIASPANAGKFNVASNALDLTGFTLEANVTGADNLFTSGNRIKVAEGAGALIGIDGNNGLASTEIAENSAMFKIFAMDGSKLSNPLSADHLYFVFQQEQTIEEVAGSSNNKSAGKVLDSISGTSNPQLSQIISNINAGSTQQVNEIISKLTPTPDVATADSSQNFVNNTLDVTNQRIASLQYDQTGMVAGNGYSGLRPWTQVFGQTADQGTRSNVAGYSSGTYGAAFGVDSESLIENTVVGAVFSYGNTKVDSRNANTTDTDINSYQLTAYANHYLPGGSFLKGMAAYAYNDVETTRHDVGGIGLVANGDFDASIYTLRAEGGHDYKFGKTRVTPSLMSHFSHYRADGYTETGAGGAGLNVGSNKLNVFEIGAGIETGWTIKRANGGVFAPELRAGYRYDLIGDNVSVASSFLGGGGSFNTQGVDPARSTGSLGAGLTYYTPANWELSANYEFEYKSDYTSNAGILRAAYKF